MRGNFFNPQVVRTSANNSNGATLDKDHILLKITVVLASLGTFFYFVVLIANVAIWCGVKSAFEAAAFVTYPYHPRLYSCIWFYADEVEGYVADLDCATYKVVGLFYVLALLCGLYDLKACWNIWYLPSVTSTTLESRSKIVSYTCFAGFLLGVIVICAWDGACGYDGFGSTNYESTMGGGAVMTIIALISKFGAFLTAGCCLWGVSCTKHYHSTTRIW